MSISPPVPSVAGHQPCSRAHVSPIPQPPCLHHHRQTHSPLRSLPLLLWPTAFFAGAHSPGTQTTSSKWQGGSPMPRQANAPPPRRTDNVYIRQSVSWRHRPTYKINSVAIHNHVNHLPCHNIAPFVDSWPTAEVHFDLQWRSSQTSHYLGNNPPCAFPPMASSLVPMLPVSRHESSGVPFQDPAGSSLYAPGTAARLSKSPRTAVPSVILLSSKQLVIIVVHTTSPGRNLE